MNVIRRSTKNLAFLNAKSEKVSIENVEHFTTQMK